MHFHFSIETSLSLCGFLSRTSESVRGVTISEPRNADEKVIMSRLEDRIDALEKELSRIKEKVDGNGKHPWWERIAGSFQNDEAYAEAMRLGSELRRSGDDSTTDAAE